MANPFINRKERDARNAVIMLVASSDLELVLKFAKDKEIKSVHIQQLILPVEELVAQKILVEKLKLNGLH